MDDGGYAAWWRGGLDELDDLYCVGLAEVEMARGWFEGIAVEHVTDGGGGGGGGMEHDSGHLGEAKAKERVKFIKGDLPREPTRWLSTHEKHGDPDAPAEFPFSDKDQISDPSHSFSTPASEFIRIHTPTAVTCQIKTSIFPFSDAGSHPFFLSFSRLPIVLIPIFHVQLRPSFRPNPTNNCFSEPSCTLRSCDMLPDIR